MGITVIPRKTWTLELVQTCLEFPFLQFLAVGTGWASVYSAHTREYCPCLGTGKRVQWHKSSSKCSFSPLLHLPPLGRDLAPGIGLVKTQRVQKWIWFGFGLVAKSCLTLCDPLNCGLPGSSVHGILQARTLEGVAISFSRGSSWPRNRTGVSYIAGRFFTGWAMTEMSYNVFILGAERTVKHLISVDWIIGKVQMWMSEPSE